MRETSSPNILPAAALDGSRSATRYSRIVRSGRALGVALAALVASATLSAQNLVTNGGFETGDYSGWTLDNPGFYGVVVSPGSSYSGVYGAYLGSSSGAWLEQSFATDIGQSYEVSFWLRVANWNDPFANTFSASVGGDTFFAATNLPNSDWTQHAYTFQASDTSTRLSFYHEFPAVSFWLDDVTVAAIPEPSTYGMALGIGALGLALWRRRRSNSGC